jgi:hypothetical protein
MRVIIAGSRNITDYAFVQEAVRESGFDITEVVSGGAKGVDLLGERYAEENNINIKRFIPDWSQGKSAGIKRNMQMGDYAEALIACWDGDSRGTKHMIEYAGRNGLSVYVKYVMGRVPTDPMDSFYEL